MFLRLELVGTENSKTTGSLIIGETIFCAFEKGEYVLDHDGLQIDLFLVVEVFSLELDLWMCMSIPLHVKTVCQFDFHLGHINIGVCTRVR